MRLSDGALAASGLIFYALIAALFIIDAAGIIELIIIGLAAFVVLSTRQHIDQKALVPTPLPTTDTSAQQKSVIREEITKKEVIIKIRCSYCNTLYDETLDKCPNCGGSH